MRVLEPDVSSPASYALKPGIAWYAGKQDRDNSISEPPAQPYLCSVPADAVPRAWHAARIGIVHAEGHEFTIVYFVDPETQHLYAQPHPNTGAASDADWGIADPRAPWAFEAAREAARWIYRVVKRPTTKKHHEWWQRYVTTPEPFDPPIPLALATDPEDVYRDRGWKGFKDWIITPRPRKRKTDGAAPKSSKPKRIGAGQRDPKQSRARPKAKPAIFDRAGQGSFELEKPKRRRRKSKRAGAR